MPEYMEAIDFPHAIDFAVQVVHDPLRVYVMGDRAVAEEMATESDIAEMQRLMREAMQAGAVGFSTGRSNTHVSASGAATPASEATTGEVVQLARVLGGLDHGVLQMVSDFDMHHEEDGFDAEFDLMEAFADAARDRNFSMSLYQRDFAPEQWLRIIDRVDQANEKGARMHMQVAPRGIGVITGLQCTFHMFIGHPSYKKIAHLPLLDRVEIMSDPMFKEKLMGELPDKVAGDGSSMPPVVDLIVSQHSLLERELSSVWNILCAAHDRDVF